MTASPPDPRGAGPSPGLLAVDGVEQAVARLELRGLADEYAAAADARDADRFARLFTTDGRFVAFQRGTSEPLRDVSGTAALLHILDNLDAFERTLHVMANQRILSLEPDAATGEVYALAHHLFDREGGTEDLVMHIVYEDRYARHDGHWLFSRRTLNIRWIEYRAVASEPLSM